VIAAAVVAGLGGVVLTNTLSVGRYQIVPFQPGVVARIDTTTGDIRMCRSGDRLWPRFDCNSPMDRW
jgi:hypothetical protein